MRLFFIENKRMAAAEDTNMGKDLGDLAAKSRLPAHLLEFHGWNLLQKGLQGFCDANYGLGLHDQFA